MSAEKQHWYGIDYLKGILIFLVFWGHVLQGGTETNITRFFIHYFHMPVFIGIAGFLINFEKFNLKLSSFVSKYWKRLIRPWVIAVIIYWIYWKNPVTPFYICYMFVHPDAHLWYILGIMCYLIVNIILWNVFKHSKYKWVWILSLSFLISLAAKFTVLSDTFAAADNYWIRQFYEYYQWDFRIYNLFFFTVGAFLRNRLEHRGSIADVKTMDACRAIIGIGFMLVIYFFYNHHVSCEHLLFFVLGAAILIVCLQDCVDGKIPRSPVIEFMGRYSLPIYLYHQLFISIARDSFQELSDQYYIFVIVTYILLCLAIYYLRKIKFVDKYIFGSTSSSFARK